MVSSAPYIFALLSDCRWHWHWLNHIKSAPFAVSCGLICWLAHANELHSFCWFHMKLRDSPDCSTVAKSIPNYWNNTIILYRRQSSTAKSEIEREWKRLIAAIYRYIAFVLCSRVFISWLLSSWERSDSCWLPTRIHLHIRNSLCFANQILENYQRILSIVVYCVVCLCCAFHIRLFGKKNCQISLCATSKKKKNICSLFVCVFVANSCIVKALKFTFSLGTILSYLIEVKIKQTNFLSVYLFGKCIAARTIYNEMIVVVCFFYSFCFCGCCSCCWQISP